MNYSMVKSHCSNFRIITTIFLSEIFKRILTVDNAYCNDPKFSDRYAWANSVDPDVDRIARSTLFAIPSASFGLITLW